jgi:hypothetical protein
MAMTMSFARKRGMDFVTGLDRHICRVHRAALVIGSRQLERVAVMTHLKPVLCCWRFSPALASTPQGPDHRSADAVDQRHPTLVAFLCRQDVGVNATE